MTAWCHMFCRSSSQTRVRWRSCGTRALRRSHRWPMFTLHQEASSLPSPERVTSWWLMRLYVMQVDLWSKITVFVISKNDCDALTGRIFMNGFLSWQLKTKCFTPPATIYSNMQRPLRRRSRLRGNFLKHPCGWTLKFCMSPERKRKGHQIHCCLSLLWVGPCLPIV